MPKRILANTFVIVLIYSLCFYAVQFFLHKIGVFAAAPTGNNLLFWDSGWYKSIVDHGYIHKEGSSNTAFFILFPWLWKILHLNTCTIIVFNVILFTIGFYILSKLYQIDVTDKLIWLSTPSLYFIFVPYTEALFFLLMVLSFYGIIYQKRYLIWISLFLVSLTRATTVFLIPSFLIMELVANDRNDWLKSIKNFLINYAWPLILGLGFFIWYQYLVTGIWLEYFKQQTFNWGHKFAIPKLPFTSMEGDRTIWLSSLGMFVSLIALIYIIFIFFKWVLKNIENKDKLLILSLCYLSIILFLTIFFNPTWGTYTTNVMGMHRYTFATPFFFVFLYHFTQKRSPYALKDYIYILILANIIWLSFGSYKHLHYLIFFNFDTFLIYLYMLYANKKISWPILIIFALNILLQLNLFQQFINNLYPD